jgi:putative OPT family oligopeptide transporter
MSDAEFRSRAEPRASTSSSGAEPSASTEPAASPHTPAFEPFVKDSEQMPELSLRALLLGTLLGMVFGASSLYLVLKVGLTVSASIPVAVISITLFRLLQKLGIRDATILENNIVQTAGSAGESIAFGVGVTMPAIMILGFDLHVTRVLLVAVLGGLLGILMMIPLRRALIVAQHDTLKYPEGTACAEVLKAGALASEQGADKGRAGVIFSGFLVGLLYKSAMSALKLWKEAPQKVFGEPFKAGSISAEISPELLGVGYIIGPRIACVMCAGGALTYLVLIPLIKFFGDGMTTALAPGLIPISAMGPSQIRQAYILYIGAGAVTAGGILSLVRSLPTIWQGIKHSIADVKGAGESGGAAVPRTQRDLSTKTVGIMLIGLLAAITLAPSLHMNLLGALMVTVFGFLFVTVSSRLTGEIGSSSNPISGMTVATLLFTCLIFLLLGWTGPSYYVTALSVGAIVCIASSNGGTISQDLKTGYLVGATPRLQQISILVGAFASALMLGPVLLKLNDTATVYVPVAQLAPAGVSAAASELGPEETLSGPQANDDTHSYRGFHKRDAVGGPAGKYLVDAQGKAVWFVDPGINGSHDTRPDGSKVRKFDAPKATLMSYIIKGILDQKLPWGLVLFGVMIALVLELSGVPSLAFAVGVYLPISSSTPILVGGAIRYWVDKKQREGQSSAHSEAELQAESDKSPGVLLASGYIAGGAIAGIVIAFMAGVFGKLDSELGAWASAHNPFFEGPHADLLSLLPFVALAAFLVATGWQKSSKSLA